MGVTENMILSVISQYPNGLSGSTPLFDDLLGVGAGGRTRTTNVSQPAYDAPNNVESQSGMSRDDVLLLSGAMIGFVICKFVLYFGWILSIVLAVLLGGLFLRWGNRR